jgi:DNA-binding transcriptional LysR family regulator
MEREFGVSLVHVIRRQVKLTDEGRLLVDRAAPVVEGFDGLRELFRAPSESVPRRIVLAMPPSLLLHELRQPLAAYRRAWPSVEIDVLEGTSAEALTHLEAGEADVAIAGHMQGSRRASSSVQVVPLLEYPFVVLAPPGHPLLALSRLKLTDLVKHPLVLTREGSFSRERVVGVFEEAGRH